MARVIKNDTDIRLLEPVTARAWEGGTPVVLPAGTQGSVLTAHSDGTYYVELPIEWGDVDGEWVAVAWGDAVVRADQVEPVSRAQALKWRAPRPEGPAQPENAHRPV